MKKFKIIFVLILFLLSSQTLGSDSSSKLYLKAPYGQIHQSALAISQIITTFECGQPLTRVKEEKDFSFVKFSNYEGFIKTSHLSSSKPTDCPQDKYRKFFEMLELGISDMHYWGKLQDMFVEGSVMP